MNLTNFLNKFWIFLSVIASVLSSCSNEYGYVPCATFLPALPGKTPPCARPGFTYCEYPDRYPSQLITNLVEQWKFDHSSILKDESKEEFSSYFYQPPPPPVYGAPGGYNYKKPNVINHNPIFIPKPQNPLGYQEGYSYTSPNVNQNLNQNQNYSNNLIYQDLPLKQDQYYQHQNNHQNIQHYNRYLVQPQSYYLPPAVYPYHRQISKRKIDKNYRRLKRSLKFIRSQKLVDDNLNYIPTNSTESLKRRKRQFSGPTTLCTTRSSFIMPKAALNNKGDWKYIVNMPEADSRYSQLVKSEICVSQTCSGLCSLPQGYSSRCEQKYIQKRLVALDGSGNNLYNDVFWFPSCCVCSLSNN